MVLPILAVLNATSTAQEVSPSPSPDRSSFDVPITPRSDDQLLAAAVKAFRGGDLVRVRDLTKRAVAQDARSADAFKLLAIAEYFLGEPERFETHIRKAVALAPHDVDSRYHLGRYLSERGRYREADAQLGHVVAEAPDHYRARYYRALVAEAMGELQRAEKGFRAAIATIERLGVRYAWPYADLGRFLVTEAESSREVDGGLGWLYRAVRHDPESPYAQYQYGKALFEHQGTTPDAERALRDAIRLDPGYAAAYYVLGRYYARTGDKQQASEMYAKFESLREQPAPSRYGLRR